MAITKVHLSSSEHITSSNLIELLDELALLTASESSQYFIAVANKLSPRAKLMLRKLLRLKRFPVAERATLRFGP